VAVDGTSGRGYGRLKSPIFPQGEATTTAPLVVGQIVIVGAAGRKFGIQGWLKGLDLKSGQVVWTARNMGPDDQMLCARGLLRRPTTAVQTSGRAAGQATLGAPEVRPYGDGLSYDSELDLVYYGTGKAAPYNPARVRWCTGDGRCLDIRSLASLEDVPTESWTP